MKRVLVILLLFAFVTSQAQNLTTVFEISGGKETATYEQAIEFYSELSTQSEFVSMKAMGETDSGYPLHLVILDIDKHFDFDKSRKAGKTIVLINNGIHPGEPDGIEASMMLIRDYATNKSKRAQLENIVIAAIPIYNIGGALNRNAHSRVNQVGPKSYGFRGNARNFDLNRDFIKADTRNARAFHEIFHKVNPDVFIDTHVSNGADYQYSITHLATQADKMGGKMGEYIRNEFTPKLTSGIQSRGSEITPYVNVFNATADKEGFSQFMDSPRYSTGYTALFHTLGFMIETHMLKPFDVRVKASYHFLETVIEIVKEDSQKIKELRKERMTTIKPGETHPISWKINRDRFTDLEFKGYEGQMVPSKVTGKNRLKYDRDKPYTKTIPYYNYFDQDKQVEIPMAYIIPKGWHNIIEKLMLNSVRFQLIEKDTLIEVESYRIDKYNSSSAPYEGHYIHRNVEVKKRRKVVMFKAGDYIVPTEQFAGRYIIETLEPEAPDSFFAWNFFDTILQQKEGFSPYVFEDLAEELLKNNPQLKEELENKKKTDSTFADNWYAQLSFIYKNSPHYEQAHMQYPVYRLMK